MEIKFSFPRYPVDILFCMVLNILLLPLVLLNWEGTLRIIIGLPFILFIPGYTLVFALFPEKKTDHGIDVIERIALSLGLSLAVVPLIGLGLNYTIWGIRLEPVLFSLFFFNMGLGLIGVYRWYHLEHDKRFIIDVSIAFPKGENRLDKALTVILVITIVIAISLLVYAIVTPKTGEQFTEFYLLGPNGLADEYPRNLTVGEKANLIVGIINHEGKRMDYRVEVWLINQSYEYNSTTKENETIYYHMWYMDTLTVSLDNIPIDVEAEWTPQWEENFSFSINHTGNYKLAFLLYNDTLNQTYSKDIDYQDIAESKVDSAYRSLHIWVYVTER
jgi:uncharacterized membrane protein